jgi:hypothetical protein
MNSGTHKIAGCGKIAPFVGVILVLIALCPTQSQATTALAIATAGADLALASGLDAVSGNPAHLGKPGAIQTQLRLFSVGGGLRSNSLGWSDYRRYNGTTLTADDKSAILDKIPGGGFALTAEAGISALALRVGQWALTTGAVASGRGLMDEDALELLFYGNAHRADWIFEDSDAEGMAAWQIALSHGRRIGSLRNRPLYFGISVAHIRGLYFAEASEASARLATETTGLVGDAAADLTTSTGGSGWGLDLGIAYETGNRSLISLKLENLIHTVQWNRDVTVTHYSLQFDDLTIDNFDDTLWTSDEIEEARGPIRSGLPPHLRLGWGLERDRFQFGLEASAAFAERFAASTKPILAAAVGYWPWSPVHLRTGWAAGGESGITVGWGLGLNLGPVVWNAAVGIDRGLWVGSGRGLSGAMSLDLNL